MTDYGIKVSEEGHDVFTAEDKNLSLKSGMTLVKVYEEATVDLDGTGYAQITHSLGYEPQFLAWSLASAGIKMGGAGLMTGADDFGTAFITTTALNLYGEISSTARYYIFYEQLSTGSDPGYNPTNDYGIKVSKDGVNVNTANILEQTFNSEKNCLKIAIDDSDSNTVNTSYNFLITHGLEVVPGYLVYFEVDGDGNWYSENETDTTSGKGVTVQAWTDDTRLQISCTSSASCTVKVRYMIFADQAE